MATRPCGADPDATRGKSRDTGKRTLSIFCSSDSSANALRLMLRMSAASSRVMPCARDLASAAPRPVPDSPAGAEARASAGSGRRSNQRGPRSVARLRARARGVGGGVTGLGAGGRMRLTPCCLAVGLDEGGADDAGALEHDRRDNPW